MKEIKKIIKCLIPDLELKLKRMELNASRFFANIENKNNDDNKFLDTPKYMIKKVKNKVGVYSYGSLTRISTLDKKVEGHDLFGGSPKTDPVFDSIAIIGYNSPNMICEVDNNIDRLLVYDEKSKTMSLVSDRSTIRAIKGSNTELNCLLDEQYHLFEKGLKENNDKTELNLLLYKHFFEFPNTDIAGIGTQYYSIIGDTDTNFSLIKNNTSNNVIGNYLKKIINKFYESKGSINKNLNGECVNMAKQYAKSFKKPQSEYMPTNQSLLDLKLYHLIFHGDSVKRGTTKNIIEEFSTADFNYLQGSYTVFNLHDSTEKLKPGVDKNAIQGFEEIIDSKKIWDGKNRDIKWWYMSSVAEALGHLSKQYPFETFTPRVKLIEKLVEHEDVARRHYVHSFNTQKEKEMLGVVKKNSKNKKFKQRISNILDGTYDKVIWG